MTEVTNPSDEAGNARPYTVSELAGALKRTIEAAYGFVRLRGEISKVTRPPSGHIYLDLKDQGASISGVVWATRARSLSIRPETGLEVIVTGKITTYPGRSQYQIVIETMEPAGEGALLAQLERLKKSGSRLERARHCRQGRRDSRRCYGSRGRFWDCRRRGNCRSRSLAQEAEW